MKQDQTAGREKKNPEMSGVLAQDASAIAEFTPGVNRKTRLLS
jgi:hypothetical protein